MSKLNIDDIVRENISKIVEEIGEISKENRGKFTATQKRTGKSTEELCHSKNPLTRKRANFAKMAKRGWKPLKENDEYEDLTPFEEYQEGYPNSNFDVSSMTCEELAKWCQSVGDFLFVYNGLRGWSIMVANADNIVHDIVNDLYDCNRIEPTHEVDYLFANKESEFINDYVCIFKVIGTKDGDYYIVYQQEKNGNLQEKFKRIDESFKSNELRGWFKLHGGVKKIYDEYPQMNVPQDGLGDITDNDIMYLEEFGNVKDAENRLWHLNNDRDNNGKRSAFSNKNLYTIYKANDGYCLVVGLDKDRIETGLNWGGEHTKKTSDRIWRDDKDPESYRVGKYVDDKDKYYYGKKGQYFGVRSNKDFKNISNYNKGLKDKMSDKEWKEYQSDRVNHMNDYLKRNYGKGIRK